MVNSKTQGKPRKEKSREDSFLLKKKTKLKWDPFDLGAIVCCLHEF